MLSNFCAKRIKKTKEKTNHYQKLKVMEIKVNIPKNDYVQPTEVRQEVEQAICDAFLACHAYDVFYPGSGGRYRDPTLYVLPKGSKNRARFADYDWVRQDKDYKDKYIRIHGSEMKAAFQALRDAGYHIFYRYHFGNWKGYECNKRPYLEGATEARDFTEFID